MRFFLAFIFFLQFFIFSSLSAQNIDSPSKVVDSSRQRLQRSVNEFDRWQDSVKKVRLQHEMEQNGKSLAVFLQEMKERERQKKQQTYIRIGLGILFLMVLVFGLLRRKKRGSP